MKRPPSVKFGILLYSGFVEPVTAKRPPIEPSTCGGSDCQVATLSLRSHPADVSISDPRRANRPQPSYCWGPAYDHFRADPHRRAAAQLCWPLDGTAKVHGVDWLLGDRLAACLLCATAEPAAKTCRAPNPWSMSAKAGP